jgi:hypothetical protein
MARWNFAFFDSGVRFDSPDAHPTTMRKLSTFLENPFDDPGISIAELLAFTTDHLQRMIANNASGELTARITATTSSYQLVADCVSDDETKLALRMARNLAKKNFRDDTLLGGVERIEAGLISAYADSATVLMEALPKGRTIFRTCRDDELVIHLSTLHTAVTAHAADLAPAIVTLANGLKAQWTSIVAACAETTGAKTTTQEGKKLARQNLQLMLFLNLNKLGQMFPRQPEKLPLYMQEHLLRDRVSGGEEEEQPPAPSAA